MKTFTVMLNLSGRRGGLSIPQVQVSSREAAEAAVRGRQQEFAQLMEYPIIRPSGPDGGEMVMTVKQLLNFMGLETVGHFIDETEVKEGERLVQPRLILEH